MEPIPCSDDLLLLFRDVLTRVGDKWSLFVVYRLGDSTRRFSELHKEVEGISERMLTVTLRSLERDGLITRTVFPVVPPRVDYKLTELGTSLLAVVESLFRWTAKHTGDLVHARDEYDSRVAEDFVPTGSG